MKLSNFRSSCALHSKGSVFFKYPSFFASNSIFSVSLFLYEYLMISKGARTKPDKKIWFPLMLLGEFYLFSNYCVQSTLRVFQTIEPSKYTAGFVRQKPISIFLPFYNCTAIAIKEMIMHRKRHEYFPNVIWRIFSNIEIARGVGVNHASKATSRGVAIPDVFVRKRERRGRKQW